MKPPADQRLATLIDRIAAGDRHALRALYTETAASLLGLAMRLMGDRAEAEAVLQDTYLTIWQNASTFDAGNGKAWIWVITVLRHTAYRRLRARGREASLEDDDTHDNSNELTELEALMAELGDDRLKQCLDGLDPEQRATILLSYLNGLSQSQLADRLRVPLDAVRQRVRQGLESLKNCLS
ncbi:MAG: sigma-70 family RNA polymerase sigma factor [Pseudomonadota bacterium]